MNEHGSLWRRRFLPAAALLSLVLLSACETGASSQVYGESCKSGDPVHVCVGVKYVSYKRPTGAPVVSLSDAIFNIQQTNKLWAQCNLGFQIEEYVQADAASLGLPYNTGSFEDLDNARRAFVDWRRVLLITTGPWNRKGTLGDSKANAWTSMPGSGPFGSVFEQAVGTYSYIVAHELGHYLNLFHESDGGDLMNPVIYTTSTRLDSSQCADARSAAKKYWRAMLR